MKRTVVVTPHAVKRYHQRVNNSESEKEIVNFLTEAAKRGKTVHTKLGRDRNKQYVLRYHGVEILVAPKKNRTVIITCYGDVNFARWYRKEAKSIRRAFSA